MNRGNKEHQRLAIQVNELRDQAQQFVWWWGEFYEQEPELPEKILLEVEELLHRIGMFTHNIDPLRNDFIRLI